MLTSTLLCGNGISLALDSNHFTLATGINTIWNTSPNSEKNIIALGRDHPPISEDDLEDHHLILTATKTLAKFQNENINWLHSNGIAFEELYGKFIFEVACHFYNYEGSLPEEFVFSLRDYIRRTNTITHIATLNYDKLIYQALYEQQFLRGYQEQGLVDGFNNDTSGFKPEHMERRSCNFGWYLHLHGSPLFYSNQFGDVFKDVYYSLSYTDNSDRNHIVLAPTKLKPSIISNSDILDFYLTFFSRALNESDSVYLIGYSGTDNHINYIIKNWLNKNNTLFIIEWEGSGTFSERKQFWKALYNIKDRNLGSVAKIKMYSTSHFINRNSHGFINATTSRF